jgi:outer membrane receptor protein involved in Fe transport
MKYRATPNSLPAVRAILIAWLAAGIASPAAAQAPPAKPGQGGTAVADLSSLDLESLLNLKVTTASKVTEKLSQAPGVISVVTKDELRRFGGITLREVLERVTGLSGTSTYFTDRSLVAVRGNQTRIDGGHILILINGRPTREILQGGIVSDLMESFPLSALERIEVIRGPGSVLYGSNAFSGVINLITQKASGQRLTLTGFGGEKGARGGAAQAMFTRGDLEVFAAGQFRQKPDWGIPYRYRNPATGAVAAQNVNIQDHGPGAYLGVNYKGLSFMSSLTEWKSSYFVRGTVGENQWRRGFADLGYTLKPRDNWDMGFNLTYTRNTLRASAFPAIRRDSTDVVGEWTNSVELGSKDRVTFGTLFNHIQGRELYYLANPNLTISRGSRPGGALYAQWDHQLLSSVKLIGGLQAIKFGDIDLSVVPRGGVVWNPSEHLYVKGLYSEAFRAPSINETRLDHPTGLKGNRSLRPEKVGTLDIGIGYQSENVQAGVNYFRSRLADTIGVVLVDPSVSLRRYSNLGAANFQGVEMEGKYYFRKNLLLMGSVMYQANDDGAGKSNVTPVSNWGLKAGASYETGGLTMSLFENYQGPLARLNSVNPPVQAYHLVTARVRYDLSKHMRSDSKHGYAFFVHADNLANRQVWLPDWGGAPGDTIPVHRGRTVYFGLEVTLKGE